ncbi:MAG: phosphoribosylanthranilate isomerase [Ruminococcus sp.]|nr:phosphoribosylanthranilate isomerase [Ruminococcus sp.]MCM1382231.1 phosphoribosylanthranilate isomerase [Muribaculaceae bacterium]MCM1479530.1 phosphoribosylanthranilate isomerase [Muribaculaceae bacterium]
MIAVKFCGMRRVRDIEYANECRPDYVGFILSDGFKRSVSAEEFLKLSEKVDKNIKKVGVFVNESPKKILELAERLDVIQLHGEEDFSTALFYSEKTDCEIWKAVRARSPKDIEKYLWNSIDKVLIDSFAEGEYGGTGKRIDTGVVKSAKIEKPFFIAGGIDGDNLAEILREVTPYGIDVSSGIETEGVKDLRKMKNIMRILREDFPNE